MPEFDSVQEVYHHQKSSHGSIGNAFIGLIDEEIEGNYKQRKKDKDSSER